MISIKVCLGTGCHLKGSYYVINVFQKYIEEYNLSDKVEVSGNFCLGNCARAVSVKIDDGEIYSVSPSSADKFFEEELLKKRIRSL